MLELTDGPTGSADPFAAQKAASLEGSATAFQGMHVGGRIDGGRGAALTPVASYHPSRRPGEVRPTTVYLLGLCSRLYGGCAYHGPRPP
eukprot:scaffold92482_cov54-Phaeocystis_antarctica.AAC.1